MPDSCNCEAFKVMISFKCGSMIKPQYKGATFSSAANIDIDPYLNEIIVVNTFINIGVVRTPIRLSGSVKTSKGSSEP
jgi:hypothetical protein